MVKLDYKQSLHNFKKFPIMLPQYEFLSLFLPYLGKKKSQNSLQIHSHTSYIHPEMETVNRGKIILGLELNLILFYVGKVLLFSLHFI